MIKEETNTKETMPTCRTNEELGDAQVIYAHPKLPELLELSEFWELQQGLWRYRLDENTDLFVDFRTYEGGNSKGRRYAVVHEEGKPEKWITAEKDVNEYPKLVLFKQRRDELLEKYGEQPTHTNINESDKKHRYTKKTPTTQNTKPREKTLQHPAGEATTPPELNINIIKQYINPTVTDQEAYIFLELCKARGLNPFTGEVHLVKYGNSPAVTIVGKDAFMKRAEQHPKFNGFEAGVTVICKSKEVTHRENEVKYREGSAVYPNETLLGGWARIYRNDHEHAIYSEVTLTEYTQHKSDGTPQRFWNEKPATMIRKVALVQALREAFPSALGGLYDATEQEIEGS